MNLDVLWALRSRYPRPVDTFQLGQQLRKNYPSDDAIWLLQQLEGYWDALRLEAFEHPQRLLYESEALQMASRWPLARRRAEKLASRFPAGRLLEVGAGIGGDTLELGRVRAVHAYELDARRLACLRHNVSECGLEQAVECLEGDGLDYLFDAAGIYCDPARRDGAGRQWRSLTPDPREIWELDYPACLKLAPGLDESELPAGVDIDYVSHQGVCKEAVVWRDGHSCGRVEAWMVRNGEWFCAVRTEPPDVGPVDVGCWVHEPDPAAIRARCWLPVEGRRIDESLALLVTPPGVSSPWTQAFEVLEVAPADLKSLGKLQKRFDFHPLEIKKRGFDVEPEQLRRKLPKGRAGGPGVLILTRVAGRHQALVCRRVGSSFHTCC